MLENVQIVNAVLRGNCNTGVTKTNRKGYYGLFEFWLNEHWIANLLSIPQLEKDGFDVDYKTKQNWIVTTPQGKEIVFQKDTGMCKGMPFIDMREHHDAFAMVQTVQENFKGFTEKQVKKAILACEAQAKLAHPTDEKFKNMVSSKSLDNCPVKP